MAVSEWEIDPPLDYPAHYLREIALIDWPSMRYHKLRPLQEVLTKKERILGKYLGCKYATRWRYIMNYLYRLLHVQKCELFDELERAIRKIRQRLREMEGVLKRFMEEEWVEARFTDYLALLDYWRGARSRRILIERIIRFYLIMNAVLYSHILRLYNYRHTIEREKEWWGV